MNFLFFSLSIMNFFFTINNEYWPWYNILFREWIFKVASSIACKCLDSSYSPYEVWTWVTPWWLCTLGWSWVTTLAYLSTFVLQLPLPTIISHPLPSSPTHPNIHLRHAQLNLWGPSQLRAKHHLLSEVDCVWAPSLGPLHMHETPQYLDLQAENNTKMPDKFNNFANSTWNSNILL